MCYWRNYTIVLMNQNKISWNYLFHVSFSQVITENLIYNGSKITYKSPDVHCMKSFCIRNWPGPYFSILWVNTDIYYVSLYIEFKYRKKRSEHGYFLRSGQILYFIRKAHFSNLEVGLLCV